MLNRHQITNHFRHLPKKFDVHYVIEFIDEGKDQYRDKHSEKLKFFHAKQNVLMYAMNVCNVRSLVEPYGVSFGLTFTHFVPL